MAETTIDNPQVPPNPTKFYTHFLYKAIFVSIFLLILPLFPSQAPDLINNKTLNTTSWEFLQLIFVGIAVSYGLFSKRNDESESHKEETSAFKSDNAQSYVAGLLQVSSVFDDDSENQSAHASHDKVQTWNSQYYRGEPIVVVAKDTDDASTIEKPLLLPVRSLKKPDVSDTSVLDSNTNSVSRSNWRRVSKNLDKLTAEASEDENIVLRSPIPWRSRSGRMEMKEETHQTISETNPIDSPSPRYQYSKSSNYVSNQQNHSREDGRKITHKSSFSQRSPPPPPPPPPPPAHRPVHVNHMNHTVRSVPEEFHNRGRRSSEHTMQTRSERSFSGRFESESDEYLSRDSEIERFIERKGSRRKQMMDEDNEYRKQEKKKVIEDSDDSAHEEEKQEEKEEVSSVNNGDMVGSDNGPDVDKKADEFIAKFREQIRLQRIASIRKSTTQNGSR